MRELRQRMTDDMVVRRMSERTQEAYLAAVAGLARYYRRSPDQLTDEDVQAYLLHLIRDRKRAWSTCNIAVYALRLFYHVTVKRDRATFSIPAGRTPSTLPNLAALQRAMEAGQLTFAGGTADLADRRVFTQLLGRLRTIDWVVYAKRPFAGPAQVLEYLARYTHRVALSNDRLVSVEDGVVRFVWKDYADQDRRKVLALGVDEFLRRVLLHVLPRGFMRIRHVGLLANRQRTAMLAQCRQLLAVSAPAPTSVDPDAISTLLRRCPVCHVGHWLVVEILPRLAATRAPLPPDSS